jgi:cell wall-associated NlpC family hydrolase
MATKITRQQIVTEALTWLGTPYHHHQCVKGVGVDCVQLLFGVGKNVGFVDKDDIIPNYEPLARGSFMIRQLEKYLVESSVIKIANVLVIRFNNLDTHSAIVVDEKKFVHASATARKVCYGTLESNVHRIIKVYEVPGVIDG